MKQRKCATCSEPFTPQRMGQIACSPRCAYQTVERKKATKYKLETARRRKEMLDNDKGHWEKNARIACHMYIRARDRELGCISCGVNKLSVQYAAGHYRPSGVNSALRFDERNIHKQCNRFCNMGLSGNLIEYRKGLIKKLGADVVEWLDNNHETKRWTIDELKEIESHYRKKLKELNDAMAPD